MWATLLGTAALLARARSEPQDPVTMHRVMNGECGQVLLDRKFEDAAHRLAGLAAGPCAGEGYTEAEGSRAVELPLLGQVTLELYKKKDLLDLAVHVGSQVMGLEGGGPCCRACEAPLAKYRSLDAARGRCAETCTNPASAWFLRSVEPGLEPAGEESCAALGFPAYNSTATHGISPLSVSVDVYGPPQPGVVTLHKIVGGMCGQAVIDKTSEAQTVQVAGLQRGDCLDQGYTEAAGSKALALPVIGETRLALFRQRGALDLVDALRVSLTMLTADTVTLYKITDNLCGEATIDMKFEVPAEQFAGLARGACKEQGYTQPAGSKGLTVPVLGDVKIALYRKAAASEVLV